MEYLEQLLGTDLSVTMRTVIAFAVVLILILFVAWIFRRLSYGSVRRPRRGRVARLAVLEAIAVDQRRRLVLLRRDNTEHLVMIGGAGDLVIEQGIQRGARPQTQRTEPPLRHPAQARNGEGVARTQPPAPQPAAPTPTPPAPAQPARPAATAPAASLEPKAAEPKPAESKATPAQEPARPAAPSPLAARTAPQPAPQPTAQTPPRPTPPAPPPSAPPSAGAETAAGRTPPQPAQGYARPATPAGQPVSGQPARPAPAAPAQEQKAENGEMSDSERQLADMANRLKDALNIPAKGSGGEPEKTGGDRTPSTPQRSSE